MTESVPVMDCNSLWTRLFIQCSVSSVSLGNFSLLCLFLQTGLPCVAYCCFRENSCCGNDLFQLFVPLFGLVYEWCEGMCVEFFVLFRVDSGHLLLRHLHYWPCLSQLNLKALYHCRYDHLRPNCLSSAVSVCLMSRTEVLRKLQCQMNSTEFVQHQIQCITLVKKIW